SRPPSSRPPSPPASLSAPLRAGPLMLRVAGGALSRHPAGARRGGQCSGRCRVDAIRCRTDGHTPEMVWSVSSRGGRWVGLSSCPLTVRQGQLGDEIVVQPVEPLALPPQILDMAGELRDVGPAPPVRPPRTMPP